MSHWLVRVLTCGCAGRAKSGCDKASIGSPFGSDWDYRAPSSAAHSHRSQPSDSSDDSRDRVARAWAQQRTLCFDDPRPAPPPPTPPKDVQHERTPIARLASGESTYSGQSLMVDPRELRLPEPIALPQRLRHSTSRVAMYLRHKVSMAFGPPAID